MNQCQRTDRQFESSSIEDDNNLLILLSTAPKSFKAFKKYKTLQIFGCKPNDLSIRLASKVYVQLLPGLDYLSKTKT
jgi:hypothetical protein